MSRESRQHKLKRRLEQLEGDYARILAVALDECRRGRWGLFGQNDHLLKVDSPADKLLRTRDYNVSMAGGIAFDIMSRIGAVLFLLTAWAIITGRRCAQGGGIVHGLQRLSCFVTFSQLAMASVGFHAAYVDVGPSGSSAVLANDSAGNHFVVSQITDIWGIPRPRATKTDAQGNTLAVLDIGFVAAVPLSAVTDAQGNLIVVGDPPPPSEFPAGSAYFTAGFGFIVKFDSLLTQVLASKALGGNNPAYTKATSVTTDAAGNIYVTGSTLSTDFPVTAGAFQTRPPVINNDAYPGYAYLVKLSPDLKQVLFGTYFGEDTTPCPGSQNACMGQVGETGAVAVALDAAGNIVIAGTTNAPSLPVTAGTYAGNCACAMYQSSGFITKFSADGSRLVWSTFLPTADHVLPAEDFVITALALDAGGNVVLGGGTPNGFPVTPGALQTTYPAAPPEGLSEPYAGFVAKFDSAGANLLAATYFGGGVGDGVIALSVDSADSIWITGRSDPGSLPGVPTPLGTSFVANLSADLSAMTVIETAPAGAAGAAIQTSPDGGVTVLGSQGSLLLSDPSGSPAVVAVANAAGTMASGVIAPEEFVSLYGYQLGPASALTMQIVNGVVSSSLNGYQVLFNGVAAPLLYVGPNQVNCIVPIEIEGLDTVAVQIITPQGSVEGPVLLVSDSQPAVFKDSQGFALALNQDQTANTASNPAAPGSIVSIWATGDPDIPNRPDGTILPNYGGYELTLPPSVLAGGGSLEVVYAGDAPGGVLGLMQINFRLQPSYYPGTTAFGFNLRVGAYGDGFQIHVHP